MLRNLLPSDCREAELASSGALLLSALYMALGGKEYASLIEIHHAGFWVVVLALLGAIQLTCLFLHPKLELAQSVVAFISGSWWIWMFLITCETTPQFAALALGFSNLYAFSVGFLFTKKSWQNC